MVDTRFKKGQIAPMKGKKHRPESLLKMSKAHKGQVAWNKGKHPSKEAIKKQKEAWRKTWLSNPELRKRHSESVKKGMNNPEVRKKLSELHKGHRYSPKTEFKKGLVPWMKGKLHSEESRKKMSKSLKKSYAEGKIKSWNKGKTGVFSEEARKKMGESRKKTMSTSESQRKMSESQKKRFEKQTVWNKGKTGIYSEETKRKISESTKKAMSNLEVRKKLSEARKGKTPWNKGRTASEKSRRMMSASQRKRFEKESSGMKGKKHTIDSRRKMVESHKNISEETRIRMSTSQKQYFEKFPEAKMRIKKRRAKQIFPLKDSKPEIKIQNFLQKLDIIFLKHKYIKEIEHSYQCDIFIPSMNLIIECDGNYWHKYPTGREIDNIRTKELIEKGFKVLRVWESDIKKMNIGDFSKRINLF